jgi:FtsH-binding integral membrane protein
MKSQFSELSHTRYRKRTARRRVYFVVGVALIAVGYYLMGVSPASSANWALSRAMAGMACIVVGFGMAVLPLLSTWSNGE